MSRIIELSQAVIKKPKLLQQAIETLNDLKKYQPIHAKFTQDAEGRITGGIFHYVNSENKYARGHVMLRYHGKGTPCYTPEDVLQNGHFTLMGDEDFRENAVLASLICDHYSAQVTKETMEANGLAVEFSYGENGAINVDGYENEALAVSDY